MPEGSEIIATLRPSPLRRWAAIGFNAGLGIVCLLLVLLRPPADLVWIAVLLVLGGGALWLSRQISLATRTQIMLTEEGLLDEEGQVLAQIERIRAVERGSFVLKPSNGFLVRISEPSTVVWRPGLWWRVGCRVGIGGVTPAAEGRVMADAVATLLQTREMRN